MNNLNQLNFLLVTVLATTAGIPKILRSPQEVAFFEGAGLAPSAVVFFGVVQSTSGILLMFKRTRFVGAVFAAITFFLSAMMLLSAGDLGFGLASLAPAVMAVIVARGARQRG